MNKYLLLSALLIASPIYAQSSLNDNEQEQTSEPEQTGTSFAYAPVVAYNPDYGVIGGAAVFAYPEDQSDAYYFQTVAAFAWGGIANIKTEFSQQLSATQSYGVSLLFDNFQALSYLADGEQVKLEQWQIAAAGEYRYRQQQSQYLIGAKSYYQYFKQSHALFQDDLRLTLSVGANDDSRDDSDNPTQGHFVELKAHALPEFLSSKAREQALGHSVQLAFDGRQFFSLPYGVAGVHLAAEQQFGSTQSCSLGGSWRLRGYAGDYFTGDRCILSQAEYRFDVYKRLSAVVFNDLGWVDDRSGQTAGLGIRYSLSADGKIKARADFAVNDAGETAFYVNFKQVF